MHTGVIQPKVVLATTWTHPYVGGVSTHMTLLARALGIDEREILSFESIARCSESRWARACRLAASRWRKERITGHAERMAQLLRFVNCDILHCHDPMATWAAGLARDRFGKKFKIVSTVHGPVSRHMVEHGSDSSSPEVQAVATRERDAWQCADQIIAVDTTQRQICIDQGADRDKVSVIPNAVDLDEIDSKLRLLQLAPDAHSEWLLVPRRLAPKNGVIHAINAMPLLPQHVKLWVAGDGMEEHACRRAVAELRLEGRVALLGAVPRDVVLMLSTAASATLIPSVPSHGIVEATSIAGIEAMACRVPVVASAIGGLTELIEDRKSGLLVAPGSPGEIAEAVSRLLGDQDAVEKIVHNARDRVEHLYSLPPWKGAVRAVYERALAAPVAL